MLITNRKLLGKQGYTTQDVRESQERPGCEAELVRWKSMFYRTVFDAGAQNPFYSGEGVLSVALLLFGIGLCTLPRFYWRNWREYGQLLSLSTLCGALLVGFSALLLLWIIGENTRASYYKSLLSSNGYSQITGVVHDFEPETGSAEAKKSPESFGVLGKRFYYSQYVVNGGFNKTRERAGPIENGLPVRVFYRDGVILLLQVGTRGALRAGAGSK